MNKCPNCGKEFKLGKKDAMLRKMVNMQSKLFPALEQIAKQAKDYCNECWKEAFKPVASSLLESELKEKEK